MERLRSLLRSSGQSGSPPETGRASTLKSVLRLHRSSQPKRLFSEAVDDGPFLIMQNPADVVGETVCVRGGCWRRPLEHASLIAQSVRESQCVRM